MPPPMAPGKRFLMRVWDTATNSYVEWSPGKPIERQLVEDLCNRVEAKGVGYFRSSATVRVAVQSAMQELLLDLKKEV